VNTVSRQPVSKKECRVKPVTFAIDEKNHQGLVVFETVKDHVKFSVHLGNSLDLALFLQESTKRQESGFALTQKVIHSQNLKIKKARVSHVSGESETVHLFLKSTDEKAKAQKVRVSLLEVLGMWTLENFHLYACADFIESCRDVKVELKETKSPLGADLYRRYGQKYLM